MNKRKVDLVKWLLYALALILFAVFVRNLEYLIHETVYGYHYQTEVTSLEHDLEEENYSKIWKTVREQQALGEETILDRSEFDAFADYYEAAMNQYRISRDEGTADGGFASEQETEWQEWQTIREQAEKKLTAYRFRKAMEQIREVYPIDEQGK